MNTRGNSNARGRATARAIESAAVRLATQHGAAALTVDQICAEAGVAQRTFFNHFDTKEDALLGQELPKIDEQRTREYLSSRETGVLSGALRLVDLSPLESDNPELLLARIEILKSSPALAERQASRLRPIAEEVRGIVLLKLKDLGPERPSDDLEFAASLITQMASSLLLTTALPTNDGPMSRPLEGLSWIWDRLL